MKMKTSDVSAVDFPGTRRLHVGIAVSDLAKSEAFYETLFEVGASKKREGYIKFEPSNPSVNLTLNEVANAQDSQHGPAHFGVQVKSTEAVEKAIERFEAKRYSVDVEESTTCCYAVQDKMWATDPDGNRWEVFVVLEADADKRKDDDSTCCLENKEAVAAEAACC